MRRLVPCDGGRVGSDVDYRQVGHCVCGVRGRSAVEMFLMKDILYILYSWETKCVCALNSPSDYSAPFRLLVGCWQCGASNSNHLIVTEYACQDYKSGTYWTIWLPDALATLIGGTSGKCVGSHLPLEPLPP